LETLAYVAEFFAYRSEAVMHFLTQAGDVPLEFGSQIVARRGDVFRDGGKAALDGLSQLSECFLGRLIHT
jgi:hypothetical protein